MAAKHLTRREIKEEAVLEHGLTSLSEWIAYHWKTLLIGLAGVVAVILGGWLWTQFQAHRDAAVQLRFAQALETFHGTVESANPAAGSPDAATDPAAAATPPADFATEADRAQKAMEQFSAVAGDYPGTRLGELSRYYVGLVQRDLGDPAAARTTLESVVAGPADSDVRNLARMALAGILSTTGDHAAAAAQLEAVLAQEAGAFPSRSTIMALGREYEAAGDLPNAVASYRRVLTEFPTSEDARTARSRVDRMEPLLPRPETEVPPPDSGS